MRNVTVILNNSPLRCRFREIICLEPQIALVTFRRPVRDGNSRMCDERYFLQLSLTIFKYVAVM